MVRLVQLAVAFGTQRHFKRNFCHTWRKPTWFGQLNVVIQQLNRLHTQHKHLSTLLQTRIANKNKISKNVCLLVVFFLIYYSILFLYPFWHDIRMWQPASQPPSHCTTAQTVLMYSIVQKKNGQWINSRCLLHTEPSVYSTWTWNQLWCFLVNLQKYTTPS